MQKYKLDEDKPTKSRRGNVHPFERRSMYHQKYPAVFFPFYGGD